jgi:hypothetical protein
MRLGSEQRCWPTALGLTLGIQTRTRGKYLIEANEKLFQRAEDGFIGAFRLFELLDTRLWASSGLDKCGYAQVGADISGGRQRFFWSCVRRQCDDGDVDDDVEEVQRVISERNNERRDDGGGRMRTKVEGGIGT